MRVKPVRPRRRADITPRLWPPWLAIGTAGLVAVLGAIGIYLLVTALVGLPWHSPPDTPEGREQRKLLVETFKAALGIAAGIGAVVALAVAYRRHRIEESQSHRDDQRLFTERFGSAAEQLGHDQPAVRLAGVHAMARLADDWDEQRQTCIDVLCAYLRLPLILVESSSESPDNTDAAAAVTPSARSLAADREVRQTIVRLIAEHLRIDPDDTTRIGWHRQTLDFTNAVFDGSYDLGGAKFSDGKVTFASATFSGQVSFDRAEFSGGEVSFRGAEFSGGQVSFNGARFSDSHVSFSGARFSGGHVFFVGTEFSGGSVFFRGARFSGGLVSFYGATFSGSQVSFEGMQFSGGEVSFSDAEFSGGLVSFSDAQFSGGTVDLRRPASWDRPPQFDEAAASTPGLGLPPSPHRTRSSRLTLGLIPCGAP